MVDVPWMALGNDALWIDVRHERAQVATPHITHSLLCVRACLLSLSLCVYSNSMTGDLRYGLFLVSTVAARDSLCDMCQELIRLSLSLMRDAACRLSSTIVQEYEVH